ncbi:hypothetical protein [Oceanospirillum sediminis]|uniref:Uncharacterized protein n=1 Tax=Oceanospirillum sediminis TaxID=2760088 RepID=A0A839IL18_9GAMM|nr:hypothetical protein [Oceanospirillum sediminis]MBB1485400.1 hypothetical protein [Oceanospirillum sediminis]
MVLLEHIILVIGLVVYLSSLVMYVRRTGDMKGVLTFWSAKMAISAAEIKVKRLGFLILLIGICIRIYNQMSY